YYADAFPAYLIGSWRYTLEYIAASLMMKRITRFECIQCGTHGRAGAANANAGLFRLSAQRADAELKDFRCKKILTNSRRALNAQFVGHSYQIGQSFRVELGHQLVTMHLYRHFAQTDLGCDLLVEETRGYQRQDLALSTTEAVVPRPQLTGSKLCIETGTVLVECGVNRIEQVLLANRLGQE